MARNVIETRAPKSRIKGSYAMVNGLNLYYEVHGKDRQGTPLVLLHGGLGTVGNFAPVLPALAKSRKVIGVELQGHGHTADIDRPMSFEAMADDVAGLVKQLGFEDADVCGYSLGGGVALQTAIQAPQVVRKLVLVSTACKRSGWYPEVQVDMASMSAEVARASIGSPMQQDYADVAPRPEDWPRLADKLGVLLRQEFDWSSDFARLKIPVLIVVGDADAVRTAHAVEMFELLGGGKRDARWDRSEMSRARLAILPGMTHYDILYSPYAARMIIDFLEEPLT